MEKVCPLNQHRFSSLNCDKKDCAFWMCEGCCVPFVAMLIGQIHQVVTGQEASPQG